MKRTVSEKRAEESVDNRYARHDRGISIGDDQGSGKLGAEECAPRSTAVSERATFTWLYPAAALV